MLDVELKIANESDLNDIYDVLSSSFPYNERRAKYDVKNLLKNKQEVFLKIIYDGKIIGVIAYRDVGNIRFFEYFAISPKLRSKGIGSIALEKFISDFSVSKTKILVLEVERPTDKVKKRRIAFYERFGFKLNNYDYNQPNYHTGRPVPMFLMTYKLELSFSDFNFVKKVLYDNVYAKQIQKLPNIYK